MQQNTSLSTFIVTAEMAAEILVARRASGEQGPRLPPACRPVDIATALAIQEAVTSRVGARIGGWKCGMPVAGNPVLAPIYANTIDTVSPCPARTRAGQVRIEPELAFLLGRDLPARAAPYAPAEIDAAIASTHLALERIDSRYLDPAPLAFAENLADGLLNQGLFLGPEVDSAQARAADQLALTVSIENEGTRTIDGRHPAADPRAPLYWLAEFLRSSGQGLQAGQAVITGSYAGSFEVPVDATIRIGYGPLGILTVTFTQQ